MTSPIWIPDRTAGQYTDDEVKKTPIFQDISTVSPGMSDNTLIAITRQCIAAKYEALQKQSHQNLMDKVFTLLNQHGVTGDKIVLNRDKQTAKAPTTRWGPKQYQEIIGQSFTRFLKSPISSRNGTYTLYIEEPWPDHQVPFRARLVDPHGFETRYPPRSNLGELQRTDTYQEVSRMTNLTQKSLAQHPHSPAVFFKLHSSMVLTKKCLDCPSIIYMKSSRCKSCNDVHKSKARWPDEENLINQVANSSQAAVARSLGVSRERVRQRLASIDNYQEKLISARNSND